jgi:hypothetical protein
MGGIRFSSGKEADQSAMADKFHVSTSAPNRPCSCDVRIILYSLFRCLQTSATSLGVAQYSWLVAGTTMLGDELSLLHRPEQIASSVFAFILNLDLERNTFRPLAVLQQNRICNLRRLSVMVASMASIYYMAPITIAKSASVYKSSPPERKTG